eukprot:210839-Alexandrium_andersonii.AAC.1
MTATPRATGFEKYNQVWDLNACRAWDYKDEKPWIIAVRNTSGVVEEDGVHNKVELLAVTSGHDQVEAHMAD